MHNLDFEPKVYIYILSNQNMRALLSFVLETQSPVHKITVIEKRKKKKLSSCEEYKDSFVG